MASVNLETVTATPTSVEDARNLLTQYEDQILNGCNNASCTEVLCLTGRLNGSQKPVRAYTARSARAIALTVCSGPNPRAHLCPHRVDRDSGPRIPSSEPRDPSALIQLLGDTKAVLQLLPSPNAGEDMRGMHQALDQLAMRANGQTPTDRLSSAELVGALLPEFDVLLESMSTQRLAVLEMVDREIVSKGFACPANLQSKPSDESWNSWQVILSRVNDESYQRLFRHIIKIIGARMKLEGSQQLPQRNKTSPRRPETSGRGVIEVLARRLIDKGNDQDNTAFAVVIWLKRLFADMWDGQPAITQYAGPHVLLELLQEIQHQAKSMPDDAFKMLMIRLRIADMDLAQSWAAHGDGTTKHILEYRYLFEPDQLVMCFRAVHLLFMRHIPKQSSIANIADDVILAMLRNSNLTQHSFVTRSNTTFYYMSVVNAYSRMHLISCGKDERESSVDLFGCAWEPTSLTLVTIWGNGVQVEFFNVVCRAVFSEEAQLFTTDAQTGVSYIRAGSLQPLHMFELFGMLLALAIYNGITLPIRLPLAFYRLLSCDYERSTLHELDAVELIQDGWTAMAKSLQSLNSEFVDDLEFVFPVEANGLRLSCLPLEATDTTQPNGRRNLRVLDATAIDQSNCEVDIAQLTHAWPGWEITTSDKAPQAVTPSNIAKYTRAYAWWLTYSSIQPQIEALLHGFQSTELIDDRTLSMLGPDHLRAYVEGTDFLDIQELKSATRYDGYEAKQRYMQSFWQVVSGWTQEKQKLLLKFVTAAERIPITGASHLTFIIKRAHPDNLEALPTSSTCFGTLLLPRYASTEVMAEKLDLALKFGAEGFGTG